MSWNWFLALLELHYVPQPCVDKAGIRTRPRDTILLLIDWNFEMVTPRYTRWVSRIRNVKNYEAYAYAKKAGGGGGGGGHSHRAFEKNWWTRLRWIQIARWSCGSYFKTKLFRCTSESFRAWGTLDSPVVVRTIRSSIFFSRRCDFTCQTFMPINFSCLSSEMLSGFQRFW